MGFRGEIHVSVNRAAVFACQTNRCNVRLPLIYRFQTKIFTWVSNTYDHFFFLTGEVGRYCTPPFTVFNPKIVASRCRQLAFSGPRIGALATHIWLEL